MLDSNNVLVALTGAVYVADTGVTAPAAADTPWGTGWVDLGYLSEDGIVEAHDDQTNEIRAWQNGDIVRSLISGSKASYAFTVIETTVAALELYYPGSEVTGADDAAVLEIGAPTTRRKAFGFDVIDGDRLVRWVVESGEVSERGDITYKNDEPVGYDLTITAYAGDDGVHTRKYYGDLPGLNVA